MTDNPTDTPQTDAAAVDPVAERDHLKADQEFMARLFSNNPWIAAPAQKVWEAANAAAALAEARANADAGGQGRDGSPPPSAPEGPGAYVLNPSAMLANQTVDEPTLTFAREVAHDLGLAQDEFEAVAVAWSGALANLDRGGEPPSMEDGIRQLAQRHGVEGADQILADARSFVASVPPAKADQVREMLSESGLANNAAFVERLALMHRARARR